MRTRVKICGITNLTDAEMAIEAGADALGFILYPKSPRYIRVDEAQAIIEQLPPYVERVAVVVNPAPEDVVAIGAQPGFSLWQMHGHESPEFCRSLSSHRLVKALSLPVARSREELAEFGVTAFLLDTPSAQYGGTGKVFNWDLVADFRRLTDRPLILSGGLNIDNVAEAIRRVQPYAVDVSSGVETAPGKKDRKKVREFIELCKTS
jgi:phosphoribosylanthranilate isomerase